MMMLGLWCDGKDDWREMAKFKCSDGFITAFKQRHKMSIHRLHYKHRPTVPSST